jgi:hypothetical protein
MTQIIFVQNHTFKGVVCKALPTVIKRKKEGFFSIVVRSCQCEWRRKKRIISASPSQP